MQAGHERAVLLVVHQRLVVRIDLHIVEQAIGVPLIHLLALSSPRAPAAAAALAGCEVCGGTLRDALRPSLTCLTAVPSHISCFKLPV